MIGYCGITCSSCPAYIATKAGDEKKAKKTAALWSKEFNATIGVADVWCDGCVVEGKKCSHCFKCEIRACAQKRKVENCGHCDDYACDTVSGLLKMVPEAKKTLDSIRA